MALTEWELWACAQKLLKDHGKHAGAVVAEKIGRMAVQGDDEGLATWQAIASRVAQLSDFSGANGKRRLN